MKYGIMDYEVIGDGTPVLIIHGWGISRLTMKGAFEPILEEVSGYRRYYIDLLGMGLLNMEMLSKIILLVPCIIPGEKQGRVEPLTVMEKDDALLNFLSKEERDSFMLMNVVLTKEVWERYEKYLMPALASADWDFLNNDLEGRFSFNPDDLEEPCQIPCLIIAAKQDTEVGYKDQFDLMEKYTNATYIAVEKAGHNLQIEQPEIFESVVKSWMRRYAMC